MEIDLDDIDVNQVPGYTRITNATPVWKREMIEKKNQEKIEEYARKLQREREEKEKWKNVPAWKRRLMEEKEKLKQETEIEMDRAAKEEEAMRKKRRQEAEERKREQARLEKEREQAMAEELKAVPAWKREVMMKRGGAIKNWGDERETINENENQEGEEDGDTSNTMDTSNEDGVLCSRTTLVLKRESLDPYDIKRQNMRPTPEDEKILEDWDNVPAWKREIMMKRGAAPANWGDERDEVDVN